MEALIKNSFISPGLFGVIIICFFMSFISVRCSDKKVATFNGSDLVFGKEIQMKSIGLGDTTTPKIDSNIWAIIPFSKHHKPDVKKQVCASSPCGGSFAAANMLYLPTLSISKNYDIF